MLQLLLLSFNTYFIDHDHVIVYLLLLKNECKLLNQFNTLLFNPLYL